MQAIVIGRRDGTIAARVGEVPMPDLGKHQILIKVTAAKLVDQARNLAGSERNLEQDTSVAPADVFGVVEAAGAGVAGLDVGEKVFVSGHAGGPGRCAEYVAASVEQTFVLKPDTKADFALSLSEYALAQSIVDEAVGRLKVRSLFIAAVPAYPSIVLARMAAQAGLNVLAQSINAEHAAALKEAGVHAVFDGKLPAISKQIFAETDGLGADLIVDFEAGTDFVDLFSAIADFGSVFVCDWLKGDPPAFYQMMWDVLDRCPSVRIWSFHQLVSSRDRLVRLIERATVSQYGAQAGATFVLAGPADVGALYQQQQAGELLGQIVLKPEQWGPNS